MLTSLLVAVQSMALLELLRRLWPGRKRKAPAQPLAAKSDTSVSVIVTSLNEAFRIQPCLDGLSAQGKPLEEILVVDSRSTDGTREIVEAAARRDPRIQLLTDEPLPTDWVGKVWALQHGLHVARGEWVLGIDADTEPVPGMVAGAVGAARGSGYDVVSFSPRFGAQSVLEQFIQPALLRTLVYRGGAAGTDSPANRLLANGQCFLARREVLLKHGGYGAAQTSFADDVSLARYLARQGVRVGFLDGSRLYTVRSYRSAGEMWREWGRSIDLRDATSALTQWLDILFLIAAQGLPVPVLIAIGIDASLRTTPISPSLKLLALVNVALLTIHVLLLKPLAQSYTRRHFTYWISWLADPLAVARIVLSTLTAKRVWRGRRYTARGQASQATLADAQKNR